MAGLSRKRVVLTTAMAVVLCGVATTSLAAAKTEEVKGKWDGKLVSLRTAVPGALDKAEAELKMEGITGSVNDKTYASTNFTLKLKKVDKSAVGKTFGVHIHVGPCEVNNGSAAGMHYNVEMMSGVGSPRVGPRTEVWLDATIDDKGESESTTTVKWLVEPGNRSLVVHNDPTDDTGAAGTRLACLPLVFR